jgi:hypothetical protein
MWVPAQSAAPLHDCDVLASNPRDFDRVAPPVCPTNMDVGAVDACSKAVEKFPDEARFWFQLGVSQIAADKLESAELSLRRAADEGYAAAMYYLGLFYEQQNEQKAFSSFLKAAEAGHLYAQTTVGIWYRHSHGVDPDRERAREWLTKAAERGEAIAQFELGQLILVTSSPLLEPPTPEVQDAAYDWIERSARNGYSTAQVLVGLKFEGGNDGRNQDFTKARMWFTRAAELQDAFGKFFFAELLRVGKGGPKDGQRAFALLIEAARQGNAAAQAELGSAYAGPERYGLDREPNYLMAYRWLKLAESLDSSNAIYVLSEVASQVTDQQRIEAEEFVDRFEPENGPEHPWLRGVCPWMP